MLKLASASAGCTEVTEGCFDPSLEARVSPHVIAWESVVPAIVEIRDALFDVGSVYVFAIDLFDAIRLGQLLVGHSMTLLATLAAELGCA